MSYNIINSLHGKEVQANLIPNIQVACTTIFLGTFVTTVLFSWYLYIYILRKS